MQVNVECRISRHRWEMLDEDAQHQVKVLSQEFAEDFGIEWEFDYYWIRFIPEQFLLAKLKFPLTFVEAFD